VASFSDDLDTATCMRHAENQAVHANALTIDKLGAHHPDVYAMTSIALSLVAISRTLVEILDGINTLMREEDIPDAPTE